MAKPKTKIKPVKAKRSTAKPRKRADATSPADVPLRAFTKQSYAVAAMNTNLSMHGGEIREENGKRIYADHGVEVATMEHAGNDLIVEFLAPKQIGEFAHVMRHYELIPERPGWLRFRRPATRDPRPGLDARFADVLGQARRERKP